MKIFNYPFKHIVKASEFAQVFSESQKYNVNSVGPLVVSGLQISSVGLNVTVTKGNGYCGEVVLPWIYNLESSTTDFSPVNSWNPAVVLRTDTTFAVAPNSTFYVVLQSQIDSTAAYQDTYETADTLKIVSTPLAALPSGNIIGELVIAEIVTDGIGVVSITPIASSLGAISSIVSQIAALQTIVSSLSAQTKTAAQFNCATNTPNLAGETNASLAKKLVFVKNDGNINVAGTNYDLRHGDIITSDGTQIIINHQNFWSN